ncbi:hypothetical protein ACQPW3_07805 [Actinosynnema sp. CA-248983]
MYIFVTDETNLEPSKEGIFFIYGGLIIPADKMAELDQRIDTIRETYSFNDTDQLKFDTRARPQHITIADYTKAKEEVVAACHDIGARLIVKLVLHEIAKNKTKTELVEFALNTVLIAFNNKYLVEQDSYGVVVVDRLPKDTAYTFLRTKFQEGLNFEDSGNKIKLNRVLMYATTCDGASHISSAVDITLGAFRYVVNSRDKDGGNDIPRKIFPQVAGLMYAKVKGGAHYIADRGMILRPKHVSHPPYKAEYKSLINYLASLLPENDVAEQ